MKMCEGRFSSETVALLRAAFAEFGWCASETFRTYSCVTCGRSGSLQRITAVIGFPNPTRHRAVGL
jgi:hypothetical protein